MHKLELCLLMRNYGELRARIARALGFAKYQINAFDLAIGRRPG